MNWKIPLFKIYWENDDIDSMRPIESAFRGIKSGPLLAEIAGKIEETVNIWSDLVTEGKIY